MCAIATGSQEMSGHSVFYRIPQPLWLGYSTLCCWRLMALVGKIRRTVVSTFGGGSQQEGRIGQVE